MKAILLVFLGGGLGSVLRYGLGKINLLHQIPFGTLIANILGCFLIGLLMAYSEKNGNLSKEQLLFLATGFCGGLTTFSTFVFENHISLRTNEYLNFFLYTSSSFILGLAAIILAFWLIKA